jgi:hypothetical protein
MVSEDRWHVYIATEVINSDHTLLPVPSSLRVAVTVVILILCAVVVLFFFVFRLFSNQDIGDYKAITST